MNIRTGQFWAVGHAIKALSLVVLAACGSVEEVEESTLQRSTQALAVCEVRPPFVSNFEPVLEWAWIGGGDILPDHKQVMMTPLVVELNGDGIPDVVFNAFAGNDYTNNGVMRAIRGDNGHELWTVTNPAHEVRGAANIAAGDIDGDGRVELCTIPENGLGVICFEHDGTFKFRTQGAPATNWGGPSLADLEGDGTVEIIVGNYVYSNTGTLKWQGSDGPGGALGTGPLAFAVDIDQNTAPRALEVVNDRAIYNADGTLRCVNTSLTHGLAGVGNFDGDARGEVVVVWDGKVTLMDDNCATVWTTVLPGGGHGGPPNIADFDNDGQPEVGVAGSTMYTVFDTNGAVLWSRATQDAGSHRTGSTTFDFEGDGNVEVVYADETMLRIFDGATGRVRFETSNSSGTAYENPVVADVDRDNNAELIIASNNFRSQDPSQGQVGIRVFKDSGDGWVNTRRIWNQHAYSVTNVNDDGTIPAYPATNWLSPGLNTFRSNSQGTGYTRPYAAPDLVVSDVAASCDSGSQEVVLTARVQNQGDAGASAGLRVAFYQGNPATGGTLLGVAHVTDVLPADSEAWVTLRHASIPGGLVDVWAVADDNGTGRGQELECLEGNNAASAQVSMACSTSPGCFDVSLNDYNLFLLEDYTGGHDVTGKVAAGGNISMTNFAVGSMLPATDIANTLVAGGNLSLSQGGVWGDTFYGGTYSGDGTVTYYRGTRTQGTPIDFAARFAELRGLSARLAGLTVNGTTTRESWGGVKLRGTNPGVNVFHVQATAFDGASLLSIEAPTDSFVVVNITGTSATFTGFNSEFRGGITSRGVLYNFVQATQLSAEGYGFHGTVLAPYAAVTFNNGSWDGGVYARSLTGNAEGHINPLHNRTICQ
jgi:choice-of-anchor A domain-containing protein